jgi:hypothetical protein
MPCPRRPPAIFLPNIRPRSDSTARPRGEIGEVCSAVCPICRGPMTPRLGRNGPYFHCRCHELGDRR